MRKIVLLLVLVFLGIGSTWAQDLKFEDSGSKVGKIISVSMTGTKTPPLIFKKGTYEHMTVKFVPNKICERCTLAIYGIVAGVPIPYPMSQTLVQTGLNLPLQKDKEYTFMFRLNTEESMPVLSLILQVELKDEDGNAIFSFRIPAKVVD